MNITDPRFQDAEKAREWFEQQRWPNGPWCPHCGNADPDKIRKLEGKSHRPGLYQCADCRNQFTVTVGTVFERSKVPLNKWLMAMHLMGAGKKGTSAHQLHRMLGVTYQTAWFMAHRIREAMKDNTKSDEPLGGSGRIVEADETYFGRRETPIKSKQRGDRPFTKPTRPGKGHRYKRSVLALVERGGKVRTFHVQHATKKNVRDVLVRNVSRDSTLYTDESKLYTETGKEFADHQTVKHSAGEYVRGIVHSNTVENVFSVFKRGMKGIYQHCGEAHLHRYLAEFDFRYNRRTALNVSDAERVEQIVRGAVGKRLIYQIPNEAANA